MAAPTLETNAAADTLRITGGTSGDPVTFDDVWDWNDGGGSSAGDGDVPKDGGGTAKVNTFMTEVVADGVYTIQKDLNFGNSTDSTYFLSEGEMIYFDDDILFQTFNAATLCWGALIGTIGYKGSSWSTSHTEWQPIPNGQSTATWLMYGSIFANRNGQRPRLYSGVFTFVDSTLPYAQWFLLSGTHSYTRVNFTGQYYTYQSVTLNDCFFSVVSNAGSTITVRDARLRDSPSIILSNTATTYLIDHTGDAGPVAIGNNESNALYEQKSINVHVNDKNGADVESATASATSFGNVTSNDAGSTFYRCIVDHTSGVFADDLAAGKWELTTAANAALAGVTGAAQAGAWVTGIDYFNAAEEFSVDTDADGDIAEQTLTRKKWIGTSEAMLSFAPYTFTISKAAYETLTLENIEVDAPIVWVQELQTGGSASRGILTGGRL